MLNLKLKLITTVLLTRQLNRLSYLFNCGPRKYWRKCVNLPVFQGLTLPWQWRRFHVPPINVTIVIAKLLFLLVLSGTASAARLEVPPDTHTALKLGADIILYTHIIGGALGLITGLIASLSKKGAFLHRRAGRVFMVSMLACYAIGAVVAPFLSEGQRPNFVAAILALYLLVSGIQAARKRTYTASTFNIAGCIISLSIALAGVVFMYMGSHSESGTVDGSPPDAFLLFVIAGTLACIGEVRVLIIKQLSAQGRVYRHLWRMCFSFFIASGSLFSGQPQVFPEWFTASPLPALCSAFPLFVLIYWTIKTLWNAQKKRRRDKQQAATAIT